MALKKGMKLMGPVRTSAAELSQGSCWLIGRQIVFREEFL